MRFYLFRVQKLNLKTWRLTLYLIINLYQWGCRILSIQFFLQKIPKFSSWNGIVHFNLNEIWKSFVPLSLDINLILFLYFNYFQMASSLKPWKVIDKKVWLYLLAINSLIANDFNLEVLMQIVFSADQLIFMCTKMQPVGI